MDAIGFGVDLSHHQDPKRVPWDKFKASADFVICRASYGGGLRDRAVFEHMRRAREINVKVGLYQFYRPSQSVDAHFHTLEIIADAVGLGDGDILPAIDIESDIYPVLTSPNPKWEPNLRELVSRVQEKWGGAILYVTQADWRLLGSPMWMLDHPLWSAHFTSAAAPATPAGRMPHIWQYYVGPFDPNAPGGYVKERPEYDHDRLIQPLPLIGETPVVDPITDEERARIQGLVALTLAETFEHMGSPEGALRSARRSS